MGLACGGADFEDHPAGIEGEHFAYLFGGLNVHRYSPGERSGGE